jgi:two-component system sensor histidine kinase/response regulator
MQNESKPKILCLDDEPDNLEALERIFRKKFDVFKATTAQKAFEILDQSPDISVIVSDQRMPVMTGVEFLERSIASHPHTSRILLTGYTDIESVIDAVNKGQIFRYLTKPWDPMDLLNSVTQAYEQYLLRIDLKDKNRKLEAALDELKSLDKAKNQFMILINHELKTPLTAILSFGGLLQETPLGDEQKLFADRILKSAEKLKNIIDDVLLIVKGEVGMIPVKFSSVPADWLSSNLEPDVAHSLKSKNQSLRINSNFKNIEIDPRLTQMAFNRALHNATKFGLAGSEITVLIHGDPQHKLVISIQNKGPHISQQLIDKILKPFQMDENIMNHSVGMGLGLSICNTLLRAQNAELKVQNLNDGVVVSFKFK